MTLPVVLYIPNVIGYLRILLALVALHLSQSEPILALILWISAAFLDLIDGILARSLNQTSSLGVLLDIAADNILRSTVWIAVAIQDPGYRLVVSLLVSLEWITMLCTQLHATQSDVHWKACRENDPWLVRSIFANNFKTPIGTWCILGLFCAPLFAYGSHHDIVYGRFPYFTFWKVVAFSGRAISVLVEVWLCKGYIDMVIERDTQSRTKSS